MMRLHYSGHGNFNNLLLCGLLLLCRLLLHMTAICCSCNGNLTQGGVRH